MTAAQIELKYGVKSIRQWSKVPNRLMTRTRAAQEGYIIPEDAKPDAIKNAASIVDRDKIYLLFDVTKYQTK